MSRRTRRERLTTNNINLLAEIYEIWPGRVVEIANHYAEKHDGCQPTVAQWQKFEYEIMCAYFQGLKVEAKRMTETFNEARKAAGLRPMKPMSIEAYVDFQKLAAKCLDAAQVKLYALR